MATEVSKTNMQAGPGGQDQPFRFFDNREKYLLFVTTCNEKQAIADRLAMEASHIQPRQPALRVFDAGMGDATVLTRTMRHLHARFPTVPFLVVAKEISEEDVRIGLEKMADRFAEHPDMVLVLTNMFYSEAPNLYPRSESMQARINWLEAPLEGNAAYDFDKQIRALEPFVHESWRTTPSKRTGNPLYVNPTVLIIYRRDREWPLAPVLPAKGPGRREYDFIIAAQPYRARMPAAAKVRNVLAPLAGSLARRGRMVVFQSTGKDPGMDIIRSIWPDEDPFQTNRHQLLEELQSRLRATRTDLDYISEADADAEFRYHLQYRPDEGSSSIGTSTLLAAWNAVTYVAQIEDERIMDALSDEKYLEATGSVLEKNHGLWFTDESFVVSRRED